MALPTEEWLRGRQQYVGASDVAGILGLGDARYHSPVRVWASKVGEVDVSTSVSAQMGHHLEPLILDEAGRRLGGPVLHCGDEDLTLKHPRIPLAVHLDGLWQDDETGQQIPIEAKFSTGDEGRSYSYDIALGWDMLEAWLRDKSRPYPAGTIQSAYYVQVQAQLSCTEAPYAYIAAAIGARGGCQLLMGLPVDPQGFRLLKVWRDEELIKQIEAAVPAFWAKHVEANEPPPEMTAPDLDALKRAFFTSRDGEPADLPDLAKHCRQLTELRSQIKDLQSLAKAEEAQIRARLGHHARALAGDWSITARQTKTGARPLRIKELKQ